MSSSEFVDYYELLQLSPNADTETIEHNFRHLAKKFHPDNKQSGDYDRFLQIVEAHSLLTNPQARAGYDVKHQHYWNRKWSLAAEASDVAAFRDEKAIRERLLALLYVQRRNNIKSPGLGEHEMASLLQIPSQFLGFHLWYLKAKGLVERLDSGHLAITAQGVDLAEQESTLIRPNRLIEAPSANHDSAESE